MKQTNKQEIEVEFTICDICGKPAPNDTKCVCCGKDVCKVCLRIWNYPDLTFDFQFSSKINFYCLTCYEIGKKYRKDIEKAHHTCDEYCAMRLSDWYSKVGEANQK